MISTNPKDLHLMSQQEKWQLFLKKKYEEIERAYYPMIDDLTHKLHDFDSIDKKLIPDFTLEQFSFIKDWQDGHVDSQYVLAILKTMEIDKVADTRITRRLTNYMFHKEKSAVADYIRPVRLHMSKVVVPLYKTYLEMLIKYFDKLVEIDKNQEKITWLEQIFSNDAPDRTSIRDYTLNQVIRQLDTQVMGYNEHKYRVCDNLVVFDEELGNGGRAIHWIFAPKVYTELIANDFKVTKKMDLFEEKAYIEKVIGVYLNAKA